MRKRGMTPERARKLREAKGIEETKLQKIRVEKGFSQKDLSVVSGVTVRSIQCYEQRTRDINSARLDTLCHLCMSLGVKIEDILESDTLIERYRIVK